MTVFTRVLVLILLICCCSKITNALSEKEIYAMVLDSLYNKSSAAIFLSDPAAAEEKPYYVYIDRYVVRTPTMLSKRRRRVDFLEKKSPQIVMSGLKDLSTCPFDKSRYCSRIIDNGKASNYRKKMRCALHGNNNTLPVQRYTFSSILYTNGKKNGLLILRQQKGNGRNESILWFVTLRADNEDWNIAQVSYRVE